MKKFEIEIDGIPLPYYKTGRGRPLFLIIGFHSTIDRFLPLIEYLSDYFTIYVPEMPGSSTPNPLPMEHTVKNYAKLYQSLIQQIKLKDYVLCGFSLGTIIAIRMLQLDSIQPFHLLLFVGIYDADYFKIPKKFSWAIEIIKRFDTSNPVIYGIADFLLHNKKFLDFFFRSVYKKESHLDKVTSHQTALTINMNSRTWLELVKDVFSLHLSQENLQFDIPTTLVNSAIDDILDSRKTAQGLSRIFPKAKVFNINLVRHSPKGPIDIKFVSKLITPMLPHLRLLAKR